MTMEHIRESKTVRGILIGLGIAVIAMLVFEFGTMVGYHRARFSDDYGRNFERNFVGQGNENFFGRMENMMRPFPDGHGAVGKVISVSLPTFIVAGPENIEKTVIVTDKTLVREFREERTKDDITTGKFVVVLGTPNKDGVIEADLVRFVPVPQETKATTTNVSGTTTVVAPQ